MSGALLEAGIVADVITAETRGDVDRTIPMYEMGSTGIFVDELNRRVSSGEIDAAVHSAKDLPSIMPDDLEVSVVLKRENPLDALISRTALDQMEPGSVIGTSSLRRKMELLNYRNDLVTRNIRGNIDTRLSKLESGEYDGTILAVAALKRIGYEGRFEVLAGDSFVPAPNQGIIALITRPGSPFSGRLPAVDHEDTRICFENERRIMKSLGLGCSAPAGIFCSPGPSHSITVLMFSRDGNVAERARFTPYDMLGLDDFIAHLEKKAARLGY